MEDKDEEWYPNNIHHHLRQLLNCGEYYLDTTLHLYPPHVDKEKLFQFMKDNNYSDTNISIVEVSLKRLEDIYSED